MSCLCSLYVSVFVCVPFIHSVHDWRTEIWIKKYLFISCKWTGISRVNKIIKFIWIWFDLRNNCIWLVIFGEEEHKKKTSKINLDTFFWKDRREIFLFQIYFTHNWIFLIWHVVLVPKKNQKCENWVIFFFPHFFCTIRCNFWKHFESLYWIPTEKWNQVNWIVINFNTNAV